MAKIHLFYGEEDFLIQEKIDQLKGSGPNLEQVDASQPDLEAVVSALQMSSLFATSKLVLIRNIDLKLKFWEALIPHLNQLDPSLEVIFWASSIDKRSKIFKALNKLAEVSEFKVFADWQQDQVIDWIKHQFQLQDKTIGFSAAEKLQQTCGNNLRKLKSEIDKLVTYVGQKEEVGQADVLNLASPGEISVFVLSEAVLNKDIAKALKALETLKKNKVEFFPLIGLLATNYRAILQVKSLPVAERQANSLARRLALSPFFLKKSIQKAKNFSLSELKQNLSLLLETDLKLKSGHNQISTFELLLTELCHAR